MSAQYREMFSRLGRYQYENKICTSIFTLNNVCAVRWGDMSTAGDIMGTLGGEGVFSTLGDIMSTLEGYHDKRGGRSLEKQLNLYGNPGVLNIPRCTHDIPHTHGIPHCTEHTPAYS